jgi:hypothetical protein
MPFFEGRQPFRITADIRGKLLRISPAAIGQRGPEKTRPQGEKRHETGNTAEKAYPCSNLLPLERTKTANKFAWFFRN